MKVVQALILFTLLYPLNLISCEICQDKCKFQLVESNPEELFYDDNANISSISTFEAWMTLINQTEKSLDISSFYWDLKNGTSYGEIILNALITKGNEIDMRIVQKIPNQKKPSNETKILQDLPKVKVRSMDLSKMGGISHSKFLIADNKHFYLGSANMDWRSLTLLKELGILVTDCECLAKELTKVFETFWNFNENVTGTEWMNNFTTNVNMNSPLTVNLNGKLNDVFLSIAPSFMTPSGFTNDWEAILRHILNAKKFIYVSVMKYAPIFEYSKNNKNETWLHIREALKLAAIKNRVSIKLLVSYHGKRSKPIDECYLKDLLKATVYIEGVDIQIKRWFMPSNMTESFLHSKYMVTDQIAYIGTSNWSGDYFSVNTGTALTVKDQTENEFDSIRSQLKEIFERDWNSKYAVPLNATNNNIDCQAFI